MSEAAELHTQTFKRIGKKETVSRNDLVEDFLKWALASFWEERGENPRTDADREKWLTVAAEILKEQIAAAQAATDAKKKLKLKK